MLLSCQQLTSRLKAIKSLKIQLDESVKLYFHNVTESNSNSDIRRDKNILFVQLFNIRSEIRKLINSGEMSFSEEMLKDMFCEEEFMAILDRLERKLSEGRMLNKRDLKFLYGIDVKHKIEDVRTQEIEEIASVGLYQYIYRRVESLKENRNIKADLSVASGYPEELISITEAEAMSGTKKFHYGDIKFLTMDIFEVEYEIILPEIVTGGVNLKNLNFFEALYLPKTIIGDLNLDSILTMKGLVMPEYIGGDLYLNSLIDLEGINFPQHIGGTVFLGGLNSVQADLIGVMYPGLNVSY